MTQTNVLRERLCAFLSRYDIEVDSLAKEITTSFGNPQLVVATGSILQGFGNTHSDIDLYAAVEAEEEIRQLPMMSYRDSARIEVCLYQQADLLSRDRFIRECSWPPNRSESDRSTWSRRRHSLDTLTRFSLGLPLACDDRWERWLTGLDDGRLQGQVVAWWEAEAVRFRQGARWLWTNRRLAACQRYADALIAGLQARAARLGEPYFTSKWLGRKFRRQKDAEALEILHKSLRLPQRVSELDSYKEQAEALLETLLLGVEGIQVNLRFAPGTSVIRLGSTSIASRWELRGIEVPKSELPEPDGCGVLWEGHPGDSIPGSLKQFVEADLLWLGVST